MKKIKVFVLVLFATQYCFAQQPCTDDALMNKKGNWKRVADANMKTGNQVQVINRIDKMQKLLQAAYPEVKGLEAKWGRSMVNDPLIANGPNPFQLYALFLTYYCNTSKQNIELNVETGTWFYVYANHFNWFMDYDHTFTVQDRKSVV